MMCPAKSARYHHRVGPLLGKIQHEMILCGRSPSAGPRRIPFSSTMAHVGLAAQRVSIINHRVDVSFVVSNGVIEDDSVLGREERSWKPPSLISKSSLQDFQFPYALSYAERRVAANIEARRSG